MPDVIYLLPSGRYKIGAHGFVYRWNNFNSEWLRSTMTEDELKQESEKCESQPSYSY